MKRISLSCFCVATMLLGAGCGKTVITPEAMRQGNTGAGAAASSKDGAQSITSSRDASALVSAQNQQLSGFNAAVETAVADQSLLAWRKATGGDEKGALKMLDDLDRQYPHILTVQFMRGQVYEHFGEKKEALKYYQMAVTGNEFSSLKLFKLAEIKRTTGDAKGAIEDYKLLLQRDADFGPAQLGLAQALVVVDKNSAEARKLVDQVLANEPENKVAIALQEKFKK
jgi:tetratricopeptide (TPR) repeat protein